MSATGTIPTTRTTTLGFGWWRPTVFGFGRKCPVATAAGPRPRQAIASVRRAARPVPGQRRLGSVAGRIQNSPAPCGRLQCTQPKPGAGHLSRIGEKDDTKLGEAYVHKSEIPDCWRSVHRGGHRCHRRFLPRGVHGRARLDSRATVHSRAGRSRESPRWRSASCSAGPAAARWTAGAITGRD
jgi:hypothetical protein